MSSLIVGRVAMDRAAQASATGTCGTHNKDATGDDLGDKNYFSYGVAPL